uniref:YARHG domain-containing protein n=1 Tax=endosymbiont of Ridgeia piscesae TaxID=54398 RepID=D2CL15_9GAMM|nr:hypothetical protein [endosymbiont of Ridgeia piscesae]
MIRPSVFAISLSLLATPVIADIEDPCPELWFARNAMLDHAGYCFSTRLGKALFDNSDCITKEPQVSPAVAAQIATIIKLEQAPDEMYEVCNIDTSKRTLDIEAILLRKLLDFQPATDGSSAICFGYTGPDIPIYAAPWAGSHRLGTITAGDNVTFNHLDWKGWSFSLIGQNGEWGAVGWYNVQIGNHCTDFAG